MTQKAKQTLEKMIARHRQQSTPIEETTSTGTSIGSTGELDGLMGEIEEHMKSAGNGGRSTNRRGMKMTDNQKDENENRLRKSSRNHRGRV
jgi:hypothetical protein